MEEGGKKFYLLNTAATSENKYSSRTELVLNKTTYITSHIQHTHAQERGGGE